jgi:hypothetical protein
MTVSLSIAQTLEKENLKKLKKLQKLLQINLMDDLKKGLLPLFLIKQISTIG